VSTTGAARPSASAAAVLDESDEEEHQAEDVQEQEEEQEEEEEEEEEESENALVVGRYRLLRKRLLRAGPALSSAKQGAVSSGTVVDVFEVTQLEAADSTKSKRGAVRGRCTAGWFTMEPELMELIGAVASPTEEQEQTKEEREGVKKVLAPDGPGGAAALVPRASSVLNCGQPTTTGSGVSAVQKKLKPGAKHTKKKTKKKSKKSCSAGDAWADESCYYQLEMTLTTPHANDTVYVAMAVPYSYSKLQERLAVIERSPFVTRRQLCTTQGGRRCDVLTVTQAPRPVPSDLAKRQNVVLSARVHPGETNASYAKNPSLEPIYTKSDQFTQTGSGQT
jgi:hypothetical protein